MDLPLVVGAGGWDITIKPSTPTVHFRIQLQTSKGHLAFNTWGILPPQPRGFIPLVTCQSVLQILHTSTDFTLCVEETTDKSRHRGVK